MTGETYNDFHSLILEYNRLCAKICVQWVSIMCKCKLHNCTECNHVSISQHVILTIITWLDVHDLDRKFFPHLNHTIMPTGDFPRLLLSASGSFTTS